MSYVAAPINGFKCRLNTINKHVDIIIIGGGINGVACAQAAAANNYSVMLLEQYDQLALATSSKSSKLIHGGLRYLESAQFKMVFECLRERRLLLKNAPHLVSLEKFHIPIYKQTRRRAWKIFIGLMIYSVFSVRRFKIIRKKHWHKLDGLKLHDLQYVFQYLDAKTDDQLLTRAVMKSAQHLGAEFITSAKFIAAKHIDDQYQVQYQTDKLNSISATVIINAAGPWVNKCLEKIDDCRDMLSIDLILGTHIVVDFHLKCGMYYLESAKDGRAVFVMPWKEKTLIGTTEVLYTQDINNICTPESDVVYLLEIFCAHFEVDIKPADIVEVFSGCRVLPADKQSVFNKSRDTIIHQSPYAVFSIYGGKLTAHRATAESVMRQISKILPAVSPIANTRNLKLP